MGMMASMGFLIILKKLGFMQLRSRILVLLDLDKAEITCGRSRDRRCYGRSTDL